MKNCKKYRDRIIFFDDLEKAEKQVIREHMGECAHCQAYFDKIMAITASLKKELSQEHMNNEMLTRLIIHENFPKEPDFDGRKLATYEVSKVKAHLQTCKTCKAQYDEMINEFDSIETYLMESGIPDLKLGKNRVSAIIDSISSFSDTVARRWKKLRANPKQKYAFIPAIGLTLLLVLFLSIPLFKESDNMYVRLGQIENTEISFVTRGAGMNLLQSGIAEFNKENYSSSVERLEQFISEQAADPDRAFAEYVCGLGYLFQANNAIGDLKPVHSHYIEKGIEHLQAVLSLTSNLRLQEGANWYIGKAHLMKEEGKEALTYFERVQNLNGRKAQKAKEIAMELKKNSISIK